MQQIALGMAAPDCQWVLWQVVRGVLLREAPLLLGIVGNAIVLIGWLAGVGAW